MAENIYRLIVEKDQYFLEEGAGKKRTPSAEALRGAAKAGRLVFEDKKIVFDPFTKLQLVLTVKFLGEKFEVSGHLRGPTHTLPLASCRALFPGTPPCVLWGHLLQDLTQDVDSRFLALPFRGTREEIVEWLEELKEEGEDAPKVELPPDFHQEALEETRPILKLKDRSGAFADLYIVYSRHGEIALHDPSISLWRKRDEEKLWEKDLLETDFQAKIVDSSHYYCPMDKVVQSLTFLLEIGWKILDYRGREVMRQGVASVTLGEQGPAWIFKGHVRYGEHQADVQNIVGALNRRERFIELSPMKVGLLDAAQNPLGDLGSDAEVCEEGVLLAKQKIGLGLDLMRSGGVAPREEITSLLRRFAGSDLASEPALPTSSFRGTLHPYQQEGLNWLFTLYANNLSALLADEMGLGKTVQVIAWLTHVPPPVLIVAPTSLLFHWRKECEKFFPDLPVHIHAGPDRSATREELEGKPLILTSYALLRMDSALLSKIKFSAIILDEAQAIKNPNSQTADAACQMQASFRLAMTGTPVENSHHDLWSIFHFLLPGLLGERSSFQAKMVAAESDQRYLLRIRQLMRPFILRRRKELVADQLPEKLEQLIWVEMDEGQRSLYEEKLQAYKQGIVQKIREDSLAVKQMEVLEAILRLRQICCHPQLADPSSSLEGSKLQKLLEDCEAIAAEGRKALIYSQFTSMLHIIERKIQEKGWGYVLLEGATRDRESVVKKFQEDPSVSFFLLSLKAGGVGLNLTAADYVLLYDPWWNDAVERQAIDRAHRLGRSGLVTARRYITAFSIEEKIMRLKEQKAELIAQIIEGEMGNAEWRLEDLLELLD